MDFIFPDDSNIMLNFKLSSYYYRANWIYVITGCMYNYWSSARTMNSVPNDEIKVWQITRTSTSLVVVCNGVTVVNFNFATDYIDGKSRCHEIWTAESNAIVFNHPHGIYGYSGPITMRIINDGKH